MKQNTFRKVFDRAKRRVRGLWIRNSSYYVQTTITDPATGLKKTTKLRLADASNLDEAKTEAVKIREKISEGQAVFGKAGPEFKIYRDHYIKTALKKPKTIYNENYFLKAWEKFLGQDAKVGSITTQNVLAFRRQLSEQGYANRTINLHVVSLRNMLKMAKMDGHLRALPTDGVVQLKVTHKEKALLEKEDIFAIAAEALRTHFRSGEAFADFIFVAMYSGGRMAEILNLKWSDIEWPNEQRQNGQLVFRGEVTKNGRTRRVDFNKHLENQLRCMHSKPTTSVFLFPSERTDKPIKSFKTILRTIRRDLDLPQFTNHLLRHYFISTCVMSGIDFMTIAKWVGHVDGGVLIGKVYGHLRSEHTAEMAKKVSF
jgi:integrase